MCCDELMKCTHKVAGNFTKPNGICGAKVAQCKAHLAPHQRINRRQTTSRFPVINFPLEVPRSVHVRSMVEVPCPVLSIGKFIQADRSRRTDRRRSCSEDERDRRVEFLKALSMEIHPPFSCRVASSNLPEDRRTLRHFYRSLSSERITPGAKIQHASNSSRTCFIRAPHPSSLPMYM